MCAIDKKREGRGANEELWSSDGIELRENEHEQLQQSKENISDSEDVAHGGVFGVCVVGQ